MHQRPQRLRVGGRVQAQPVGQGGELIRDRGGLLGGQPPHQVIAGGVRVRVLGGQLGLADPAHPVHRMHRHRPGGQRPRQLLQLPAPAGEMGVPRRDLPHPRQRTGEPGRVRHRPARARKPRRHLRLGPARDRRRHHVPQPGPRSRLGQPEHVHPDHGGQQPRPVTLGHPDRQQLAVGPGGVAGPGRLPFGPAVHRGQVLRRTAPRWCGRRPESRPACPAPSWSRARNPTPGSGPGSRLPPRSRRSTPPTPGPPGYRRRKSPTRPANSPLPPLTNNPTPPARLPPALAHRPRTLPCSSLHGCRARPRSGTTGRERITNHAEYLWLRTGGGEVFVRAGGTAG